MNPLNSLPNSSGFDPLLNGILPTDAIRDPALFPYPGIDADIPVYALRLADAAKITGCTLQDFHNAFNQQRLAGFRAIQPDGSTSIFVTPLAVVQFLLCRGPRKCKWTKARTISLDQVSEDEPFQFRANPLASKIEAIADELVRGGAINIPTWLFPMSPNRYLVIDGHTRVAGSKVAGRLFIPAVILPVPFWFARNVAFEANIGQAKDLSASEAADYVRSLLKERTDIAESLANGDMTQREAAEKFGVGQGTISKIVNEGKHRSSRVSLEDLKDLINQSFQHLQHTAVHEHIQVIVALSFVVNELKLGIADADWKAAILGLKTKSTAFSVTLSPDIIPLFSPRGGPRSKGFKKKAIPGIAAEDS